MTRTLQETSNKPKSEGPDLLEKLIHPLVEQSPLESPRVPMGRRTLVDKKAAVKTLRSTLREEDQIMEEDGEDDVTPRNTNQPDLLEGLIMPRVEPSPFDSPRKITNRRPIKQAASVFGKTLK